MQTGWTDLNPQPGIWTRFDPRFKLVAILALLLATSQVTDHLAALAALAAAGLILVCAGVPWQAVAERLPGVAMFLILVLLLLPLTVPGSGWGPFSAAGWNWALLLTLKILACLGWALLLAATTPMPKLLAGVQGLGMPPRGVHLLMLVFRYIFLLREQLQQYRLAVRLRGFRNRPNLVAYQTIGRVAGTLLVRSHDRAERVGQALAVRGYDGSLRLLTPLRARSADIALAGGLLALAAGLVCLDFLRRTG